MPCPYRCKNKIKGWRSEDRRYKFNSNAKIPTRASRIYLGGAGRAIGAEPASELERVALGQRTLTAMPGRRSEVPEPVSWARTS
jgi:hypothetical protein